MPVAQNFVSYQSLYNMKKQYTKGTRRVSKKRRTPSTRRTSASKAGVPWAGGGLAVMLGMLGVFYLVLVNGTAVRGSEITALERREGDLRERVGAQEIVSVELSSLDRVTEVSKQLNMVQTSDIAYIAPRDGSVVKR